MHLWIDENTKKHGTVRPKKKTLPKRCNAQTLEVYLHMMDPNKLSEQNTETTTQNVDTQTDALNEALSLQSDKISEVVGKKASEQGSPTTDPQKDAQEKTTKGHTDSFINRINNLLFSSKPDTNATDRKSQTKAIEKSLNNERKELLKNLKKIGNERNFSASKMEKTILHLRSIQRKINELIYMTKEQISNMYKKHILKKK